jgi:hypothetical protein
MSSFHQVNAMIRKSVHELSEKEKFTIQSDAATCCRGMGKMVVATDNDLGRGPSWTIRDWNKREALDANLKKFRESVGVNGEQLRNLTHATAITVVATGDIVDFKSLTHSFNPDNVQRVKWLTKVKGENGVFLLVNGNHRRLLMQLMNAERLKVYDNVEAKMKEYKDKNLAPPDELIKAHELALKDLEKNGDWFLQFYCAGQ